jgi:hypothetical protein
MQRHDPEPEAAARFETAYRAYRRITANWKERE